MRFSFRCYSTSELHFVHCYLLFLFSFLPIFSSFSLLFFFLYCFLSLANRGSAPFFWPKEEEFEVANFHGARSTMWSCFSFCPTGLCRRRATTDTRSLPNDGDGDCDTFVLCEFSRDIDRRPVRFSAPEPLLPRCSLCGLVPSKLYKGGSCPHAFCSSCRDQSVPACPFDGFPVSSKATPDTTPLEVLSRSLVHCWNVASGCKYVGTCLDMPSHYRTCADYGVDCDKCSEKVKIKDLGSHVKSCCSKAVPFENGRGNN